MACAHWHEAANGERECTLAELTAFMHTMRVGKDATRRSREASSAGRGQQPGVTSPAAGGSTSASEPAVQVCDAEEAASPRCREAAPATTTTEGGGDDATTTDVSRMVMHDRAQRRHVFSGVVRSGDVDFASDETYEATRRRAEAGRTLRDRIIAESRRRPQEETCECAPQPIPPVRSRFGDLGGLLSKEGKTVGVEVGVQSGVSAPCVQR